MRDTDRIVRPATDRQIQYAESLGIDPEGKSFRVLSAEIEDVFSILESTVGLRVGEESEHLGRDEHEHEISAYPEFASNGNGEVAEKVSTKLGMADSGSIRSILT